MKKIYKALVVAMIAAVAGIIVFTGCKKETSPIIKQVNEDNNQSMVMNDKVLSDTMSRNHKMMDNPPIVKVVEFHKEGGHRFLGFLGKPRYASVNKTVDFSMLGERMIKHVYVECIGGRKHKMFRKIGRWYC